MLFDLEVLSNSQKRHIEFDNITNVFTDAETGRNPLEKSKVKDYVRLSDIYSIDKRNIGVLFINLGLNCNFHCKYCHQNGFRDKTEVTPCTPDKVPQLVGILKKADLKLNTISFWGGEPLVFWKAIRLLVPELRKLYPQADITFPTNGALLNKEMLEFFRQWKVHYYISYDGKQTNRDFSVFEKEEIKEYFCRTQEAVDIMPTQNRISIPVKEIRDEVHAMGIRLRNISAYSIAQCNPWNRHQAEEIRIPQDKIDGYSEFLMRVLRHQERHEKLYSGIYERFNHFANIYYHGLGVDSAEVRACGNMIGFDVCIDCTGTIFNCMNIPLYKMGNILDFKPFDASHIFTNQLKRKRCLACPYVSTCQTGCPLISDEHSVEFDVNCNNLKALAVPMFRMVVEALLGVRLIKVTRKEDGCVMGEW